MFKSQVTVVIPTLNSGKTLPKSFESLLSQTLRAESIIVVDNGSNDDTIEVCIDWQDRLPIQLLTCNVQGAGPARNFGVEHAQTQYVAFLDSDDFWYPEKLEIQMKGLLGKKQCFSGTYMNYVSTSGAIIGSNVRSTPASEQRQMLISGVGMPVPISSVVLLRADFIRSGGFDETFRRAQDFDWLTRLARQLDLDIPSAYPLVGYALRSDSATDDSYVEQFLAAELVRYNLRNSPAETYYNFVLKKLYSDRVPKKAVSGAAYRRAGILFAEKKYIASFWKLSESFLLSPFETFRKLHWQVFSQGLRNKSNTHED